jgi:hypothetical protein
MEELMTPPSMTVGWLGSLLHSKTFRIEPSVKPLPASVTTEPFIRPASGDAVIDPAANAEMVVLRRTAPATTSNDAPTKRYFARASRPLDDLLTTTSQSVPT